MIDGHPIDDTDWPVFMYSGTYNPDLPWVGMLHGPLLIQAFIHIFLSPSLAYSEDDEDAHSENMNGMTAVTLQSIAYVTCQLMFVLCFATVFNKFSKDHRCIGFYRSICAFFADSKFCEEVQELLRW
ncbi:hypothetical protein BKA93DRAFT_732327 [Sparassis latifolia]